MSSKKEDKDYERRRIDDFATKYANNINVDTSAWDVKLTFGEVDQLSDGAVINEHTAITISWKQAKILAYLLQLQIIGHEGQQGHIHLYTEAVREIDRETPQFAKEIYSNPDEIWKKVRKHWEDFAAANPELVKKK